MEPTNPNYSASTETALDRIRASFFDESDEPDEKLSQAEFDQKCQLVFAHANLTEGKSLEKVVKLLVARYAISRATGYRRCRDATTLFADVTRTHKDGLKHILYEMSMNVYRRALKALDKFGNPDLKAANGAIKNMALLKGLDKDDSSALTPEMLGQKNYYLTLNLGGGSGAPKVIDMTNPERMDADTYARVMEAVEGSDFGLADMQLLLNKASEPGEEEGDD